MVKLHNEILDYCDFVGLKNKDKEMRETAIKKVTAVAKGRWPDCKVFVFGSFATNLCLSTSDIDIVLFFHSRSRVFWCRIREMG